MSGGLGRMTPLRRLCLERGISRSDLAGKAGVSRATVYNLEGGQIPSGQTITKLASALDIAPAELVAALFPQPVKDAA